MRHLSPNTSGREKPTPQSFERLRDTTDVSRVVSRSMGREPVLGRMGDTERRVVRREAGAQKRRGGPEWSRPFKQCVLEL